MTYLARNGIPFRRSWQDPGRGSGRFSGPCLVDAIVFHSAGSACCGSLFQRDLRSAGCSAAPVFSCVRAPDIDGDVDSAFPGGPSFLWDLFLFFEDMTY